MEIEGRFNRRKHGTEIVTQREIIKTILEEAESIELVSHDKGKFGRILGEVWVNCNDEGEYGGWTNVNQWLCENGHAVGYTGQNKDDVKDEHWKNRVLLAEQGVHDLLPWDED